MQAACTSECHALFHLRQVLKLVQSEVPHLTMGLEREDGDEEQREEDRVGG